MHGLHISTFYKVEKKTEETKMCVIKGLSIQYKPRGWVILGCLKGDNDVTDHNIQPN